MHTPILKPPAPTHLSSSLAPRVLALAGQESLGTGWSWACVRGGIFPSARSIASPDTQVQNVLTLASSGAFCFHTGTSPFPLQQDQAPLSLPVRCRGPKRRLWLAPAWGDPSWALAAPLGALCCVGQEGLSCEQVLSRPSSPQAWRGWSPGAGPWLLARGTRCNERQWCEAQRKLGVAAGNGALEQCAATSVGLGAKCP